MTTEPQVEVQSQSPEVPLENLTPKPPALSPEEEAELEKKRLLFRQLHDLLAESENYDAEVTLGMVSGAVQASYNSYAAKVLLSDLGISCDDLKQNEILKLLKGLSVEETISWLSALNNAINKHRYVLLKDKTVKDLDIQLL
jgi:hypothetical protein